MDANTRKAGILLPVFSLPGEYGIGCFSEEAYRFVDFLVEARQSFWQILPLGPTGFGDSPYQTFSSFAGNPYMIDFKELIKEGLLSEKECGDLKSTSLDAVDYERLGKYHKKTLRKAFKRFDGMESAEMKAFLSENTYWLDGYAFFMALKGLFEGKSHNLWPEEIKIRNEEGLLKYKKDLKEECDYYRFEQFVFDRQWRKLKNYANKKGISIIGDIPIYVAADSADVWSWPELFELDDNGNPARVAGCPPDGFSPKGQLWGNPLYRWDKHKQSGFIWWKERMRKCEKLYDVIRIDHFRGFDEYYAVSANAQDAVDGKWEKGPGMALFEALKDVPGDKGIIAEDLGFVTDSVRKLVHDTGFPNMKIMEFAFYDDPDGNMDFIPYNHTVNSVVYTGTHDNETLMGWIDGLDETTLKRVKAYAGMLYKREEVRTKLSGREDAKEIAFHMLCLTHGSVAKYSIIPLQDYLYLGNEARINTPAVLGGNWIWRARRETFGKEVSDEIAFFTETYGRCGDLKMNVAPGNESDKGIQSVAQERDDSVCV